MNTIDISARKKKLMDSYTVSSDNVSAKIEIWDIADEDLPIYAIGIPSIGVATKAILDSLKTELSRDVALQDEEIINPESASLQRQQYFSSIKQRLKAKLHSVPDEKLTSFSGMLLHKMYGLGDMEMILADNMLEEVVINGVRQPISVFHKKHGWCKTTQMLEHEEDIYNYSAQIGRNIGREINSLNPIMDAHLLTGDRVASTLFPISTGGNTITIRRFSRTPWTVTHFVSPEYKTMSKEIASIVWLAMEYELNIIVAGGTASGKTSVLNTLCSFIPPKQRIISIEDTRELSLPKTLHWNWVPLTSRNANPEGQGQVTMLDLIVASLRMRPDRIVVGEIRKRDQAEALFEAMHTGHSVYATMHADTANQVKRRLLEPPIKIPAAELESLHLVLVQYRDRRKGLRRTLEVAEFLSGGREDDHLELNYLYRWMPRTDTFEKVNDSIRLVEDLNMHTGMAPKEVSDDLLQKQDILEWMSANKLSDIDQVGNVMRLYYKERDVLADAVSKKLSADRVFGSILNG